MKKQSFKIAERAPTLKEFTLLNKAVGWDRYTNLNAIPQALANSLFCVVATVGRQTVGMGRLVGDGARFVYVQDLVVLPEFQHLGVGTAMMDRLMQFIDERVPRKAYVHLFTQKATSAFYARYGFKGPEESFYGMSVKKFDAPLQRSAK